MDPELRLREVAARVGVTERAVQRIVAELEDRFADFRAAYEPDGISPARLAAWMMVANALFNLDETLTKG